MNKGIIIKLILILVLVAVLVIIDLPSGFSKIGIKKEPKLKKGLDLVGGTHLSYEADMNGIADKDRDAAISSLKDNIERRINALGVAEPQIQSRKIQGKYGLLIELPGIKDINKAIDIIGKTAQLKFKESGGAVSTKAGKYTAEDLKKIQAQQGQQWRDTKLTGRYLKKADVQFDQQGNPEIAIEFNSEGAKIFAQLTKDNLQKRIAIFLDNELISAPTVQSEINDGKAVITGKFSVAEAKDLALQLNAGALPVPIKIVEQRNIGATLGEDSVKKGLVAGAIGLVLVALFMILYYKLSGFLAILALLIYALIVLGIFKLSSLTPWAMTLTLPGLAGFILSIGMAVDANILIFERTKEEIAAGKTLLTAIEVGFNRAWSSIRDSNISTLITCLILFWLGIGSIKGFALTLAIGTLASMLTAITITRTFLLTVSIGKIKEKINWFI